MCLRRTKKKGKETGVKFREFIGSYFEDLQKQASEAGRKAAEEVLPEVFEKARDMLRRNEEIFLWVVWPLTSEDYPRIRLAISEKDPFTEVVCEELSYPGWDDSLEELRSFQKAFEEVLWDAFDTRPEDDRKPPLITIRR